MNLPTARTPREYPATANSPLICFSHLRWDFVVQRPQHLMQRFARSRRVYFFEEWIPTDHHLPYLEFHRFADTEVVAVRPRVPHDWHGSRLEAALSALLDELLWVTHSTRPILWFYTPMMYALAAHVDAAAVVYDCMDVLANFRFAPADLTAREAELMKRADLVFTGGHSIFEEKRKAHRDVYAFPSSVDVEHFAAARRLEASPPAGKVVLGYYGVIDERLDLDLIADLAGRRPDWTIVMVGPVAKIDPASLPLKPNIVWRGQMAYAELPAEVAN